MKKRKFHFLFKIFALFLIVCFSACHSQKGWVYKANRWTPVEKVQQPITIPTFEDDRSNENKNSVMMYLCPLVPFGWQKLSTPELISMHFSSGLWINYDPKVDFAKALAKEVKGGTCFKDVVYTENPVDTGYYIQGRIINTDYRSKLFSYGLSIYGPLLWCFGLPAGTFSNDLAVELTCYAPGNKVVLQKIYKVARYKKTSWLYGVKSDFEYASMLKKIYSDFIRDFNQKLKK